MEHHYHLMPGPEVSDDELELLHYVNIRPDPFVTAKEIDPYTTVGYKQTRNRLDDLVEDGLLNYRRVGNVNVYWLSDEGNRRLAESDVGAPPGGSGSS